MSSHWAGKDGNSVFICECTRGVARGRRPERSIDATSSMQGGSQHARRVERTEVSIHLVVSDVSWLSAERQALFVA